MDSIRGRPVYWSDVSLRVSVAAVVGAAALLCAPINAVAQSRDAPIPHDIGQSVNPSFEGWYPNDDGTFSLSYGYFNRNYEQALDIPVGADNRFEPGPVDRGQPTHFLPRRQTGLFTVTVPADFGDRPLTWTVTAGGETFSVPGHLRPEWEIDARLEITSGNRPPALRFAPDGAAAQGPGGVRAALVADAGQPVTITLWASDDGVQKRPTGNPPQFGLVWSKFRGPGEVTFGEARPTVAEDGRAETTATFSAPGTYVLRVLAWDDSGPQGLIMAGGFQCCWTNAYLDIDVR